LTLLLRPLSFNNLNYLPSGPTATLFALLFQYYVTIPHTFSYRIGTTSSKDTETDSEQSKPNSLSLLLSDKSTTYIVASQLALSQFPAMLLPSIVGWIVGVAWRAEVLPGLSPASSGFRVPAWMVGEQERRIGSGVGERERYEDLRRRLEGEVASASGLEGPGQAQRRGNGNGNGNENGNEGAGLVDRLRGAW
jgi:hypothetical protein